MKTNEVDLQARIKLRFNGPFMNLSTFYDDQAVLTCPVIEKNNELVETTPGRIIFNDILPEKIPFINGMLKKKGNGESCLLYLSEDGAGTDQLWFWTT